MQKIPTIYVRDPEDMKRVTDEVTPGCEWVFAGEGTPTEKFDGTCCLLANGNHYKRREVKLGKPTPEGFRLVGTHPTTGKRLGWVLVDFAAPENKWHKQALQLAAGLDADLPDGTYELVGPKVQKNPYKLEHHELWKHGHAKLMWSPHDDPKQYLSDVYPMEGIVWHHPDGRMAKIKRRDFGLPWPVQEQK